MTSRHLKLESTSLLEMSVGERLTCMKIVEAVRLPENVDES